MGANQAALQLGSTPCGGSLRSQYNAGTVSIIDTTTGAVNTITVGNFPSDVVFSSDGEHAYVTNQTGNRVTIIDVASDTVVDTIAVGARPIGVAVNTDETRLYTANNQAGTVSVVDLTNNSVIATIPVGGQPPRWCSTPAAAAPKETSPSPGPAESPATTTGSTWTRRQLRHVDGHRHHHQRRRRHLPRGPGPDSGGNQPQRPLRLRHQRPRRLNISDLLGDGSGDDGV